MIGDNVRALLCELEGGNCFGEKVTAVAAVKTRTPAEICEAVAAGICDIGDNKVQEFREKYDLVPAAVNRHFIGRLQTNKVKYLIGKTALIQSVDRDALLAEISRLAVARGVVQDVLLEINIGCEESKGGYPLEEGMAAFARAMSAPGVSPRGFMAMLPRSDDEARLASLTDAMRALYESARPLGASILSMGMSGDYRLCIAHGANMVRIGTGIFGSRQ